MVVLDLSLVGSAVDTPFGVSILAIESIHGNPLPICLTGKSACETIDINDNTDFVRKCSEV